MIAALQKEGGQFEECGQTARNNGWVNADLLPAVKVNSGANLRLVQLMQEGYRANIIQMLRTKEQFMHKKIGYYARAIGGLLVLSSLSISSIASAQTVPSMAENTKPPLQIIVQTGLKVVIQVNYADTIPNGISKQVLATKNLFDQYTALGMQPGKDYEIVMVFRADSARFLLTDDAYDQKVKQPHPKGNSSRAILDELIKGGVKMYECGVAMRMKGYSAQDLLPYSQVVVSGIGALVDFEKSGYLSITP